MIWRSSSPEQTRNWGRYLAKFLQAGDILLLLGDLGAGKTELVRGLAAGLGLDPGTVSSPSFALIHEYGGQVPLVHVDLYRLETLDPEFLAALEDYWAQPVITVLEWAERLGANRPPAYLELTFTWEGERERVLHLRGSGPGAGISAKVGNQTSAPGLISARLRQITVKGCYGNSKKNKSQAGSDRGSG